MSTIPRTIEHTSRRFLVPLPMPYDRAVKAYEQLVPLVDAARFAQLATWDAVLELADINAPLGFMIYWRADVTATMAGSGSGWKSTEYLMGNHTIAERMYRHDPAIMLYAPLRTAIYEDTDGTTWFTVDQPSTRFRSFGDPAITDVGFELDHKLAALLEHLGAPVPAALTEMNSAR
jgi:hypothetical protein